MNRPRLNRRLLLEAPQKTADGAGGFSINWLTLGEVWAECTARTGRERGLNGAATSTASWRIIVRAAPYDSPSRPKPEQRLRDGSRIFKIRAVIESDSDYFLTCLADEEVAA